MTETTPSFDLEIAFPSARGGKKPQSPLEIEVIRELTEADLEELQAPSVVGAPGQRLKSLKSSHHQLAQMLSAGDDHGRVSLVTGYSGTYISIILQDPMFQELMAYYREVKELEFVDVLARLKAFGLSTLEELQERLATNPESFAIRDLKELTEMALKGGVSGGSGASSGPSVSVKIDFVSSKTPQARDVIEGEVVR